MTEVEDHLIRTSGGNVLAAQIVFAVHYPFLKFPGMYFARMHQERSYVLALEGAGKIHGMYIGDGEEKFSFRQYGDWLLLGGEGHRTGENREGGCYMRLKETAAKLYPGSHVAAAWSAQDCITSDGIPFIGIYTSDRPNMVCGDRISEMGDEFLHGFSFDFERFDLQTGKIRLQMCFLRHGFQRRRFHIS